MAVLAADDADAAVGHRLGDRIAEITDVDRSRRADVEFVVADAERDVRRIRSVPLAAVERVQQQDRRREVVAVGESVRVEHGDGDAVDAFDREVLAGRLEFGLEFVAELLGDVGREIAVPGPSGFVAVAEQQVDYEFPLVLVGLIVGLERDGFAALGDAGLVVAGLGREVEVRLGRVLPVADRGEVLEVVAYVVVDVGGDVRCQRGRGDITDVGAGQRRCDVDADGVGNLVVGSAVVDDERLASYSESSS